MKLGLLLFFLLICNQILFAKDYYVANSGNDNNSGTSSSEAWATLEKVNSMMSSFNPGDRILFEKGSVFRGTLEINVSGNSSSPIIFGAYGTGNNPIIYGSKEITGWSNNGNIWSADCPGCPEKITNLFIDNKFQPLGRYPNSSYRTITSAIGRDVIIDKNLSFPNGYWNNAEVAVKTAYWVIDAIPVSTQIGSTINLAENTTYNIPEGFGYFFQNHIKTLDLKGEWAFDKQQKRIHVFYLDDLNQKEIEISFYDYCISIVNEEYITIENLDLSRSRLISLRIRDCNSIKFNNNTISYSGGNGIYIQNSNYSSFDNNTILFTNNNGFETRDSDYGEFTNNTLKYNAIMPGRGYTGNGAYIAIKLYSVKNFLVQYNYIDSTGYNGIHFNYSENVTIKNNFVNHSNLVKDDGSGIYTYENLSPGNLISGNIVFHSMGYFDGTTHDPQPNKGIYIDSKNSGIIIENNTTAFCEEGVYVSHSNLITVKNNICFDNQKGLTFWGGTLTVDKCVVKDNYFFALGKLNQWVMYFDDVGGVNTFENNVLCDPFDAQIIRLITRETIKITNDYTIKEWQDLGNVSDKPIPFTFAESGLPDTTGFIIFDYNPTKTVKTRTLSGTYRDLDNNLVTGSVNIEPYSSIILLKEHRELLGAETTPNGPSEFCQGTESTNYSTVGVSQADSYAWQVSPESAGTLEGTGKNISIDWNPAFSGDASVSFLASGSGNYNALSPPLLVYVSPRPKKPESPEGPDSLFQNSPQTEYNISEVENAIGYEWKINPSEAAEVIDLDNSCILKWNEPFFGIAYLSTRAENECGFGEYSNSLKIKIREAELAYGIINIFTPNGDGFNDYWSLPFIRDFPDAIVKIYDRNNRLLIEYRGTDSSWNGTVNGELVPMGNYLYVIDLGTGKSPIKGYVTVLR